MLHLPRPVKRAARVALAAACSSILVMPPAGAHATGFGQPVVVSGRDNARNPQVAIAPNGRTAVLYERVYRRDGRTRHEVRAAIGRSPAQLGPPETVRAGWRSVSGFDTGSAQLLARPDGGFVACFWDRTSGRRVTLTGCSIAPSRGRFGPLHVIARGRRAAGPEPYAVMLGDSSVAVLTKRWSPREHAEVSSLTRMTATGQVLRTRRVRGATDDRFDDLGTPLAAAADGTLAIPASLPIPGTPGARRPGIRLLTPRAKRFGPAVAVSDDPINGPVTIEGGGHLAVMFVTTAASGSRADTGFRIAYGRPGWAFAQPFTTPNVEPGAIDWPDFVEVVDGVPVAIARRADPEACLEEIVAGPLRRIGAPSVAPIQLSQSEQVARWPQGTRLADGTMVAVWQDIIGRRGPSRIETAIRPANSDAFRAPQVLPHLTAGEDPQLAGAGNAAALLWTTAGRSSHSTRIVLSPLRTRPPYATQSKRPEPLANRCDA